MKKILIIAILCCLLSIPSISIAQQGNQPDQSPSVGAKFADLLLLRPLFLVGSVASTGLCIAVSVPATLMGAGEPVGQALFVAPWRYTADRELGEFCNYKDGTEIK
jgi:hypothetical protein